MLERRLVSAQKLRILEKYKKVFCEKVKFSDVSHHFLASGCFGKEDCFEICILPMEQQMKRCFDKIVQLLESEREDNDDDSTFINTTASDIWTILLRALNVQHSGLTCKLDGDLHKLSKHEKPRRITKDDIGTPLQFKHVKHIGHVLGQGSAQSQSPLKRFFSLRSTSNSSSWGSVHDDDPDMKTFFRQAGVTNLHLQKPNSRKLILEFIERSGGIEAIKREIRLSNTGGSVCSSTSSNDTNGSETSESLLTSPNSKPSPVKDLVVPSSEVNLHFEPSTLSHISGTSISNSL